MNKNTAKQIAVTWELLNGTVSDAVMEMLLEQFSEYDDDALLKALARCRAECKGRITPADIIQRIDDGRPGADEAWAITARIRQDDGATIVWTEEMAAASGIVGHMGGDDIAARMSFKDTYSRLCREATRKVQWTASLGEYSGRSGPLLEAVRLGRLTAARARNLVPELPPMPGEEKQLTDGNGSGDVKELCDNLADKLKVRGT